MNHPEARGLRGGRFAGGPFGNRNGGPATVARQNALPNGRHSPDPAMRVKSHLIE